MNHYPSDAAPPESNLRAPYEAANENKSQRIHHLMEEVTAVPDTYFCAGSKRDK